jgi:transposase
MPQKKYLVTLSPEERSQLAGLVSSGKRSARTLTRAHILLKADQADGGPAWEDGRIADAFGCGLRTVERVRQRFVEAGLDVALVHKPQDRPSRTPVLDGAAEARLIAVACSTPPEDRVAWTLKLLAGKLVELEVVESVSRDTIRRVLKKTRSSRG